MGRFGLLSSAALSTGILSIGLTESAQAQPSPCLKQSNSIAGTLYTTTSGGTTYCAADMSDYYTSDGTCTSGTATICLNDFANAMADAGRYFYNESGEGSHSTTYHHPFLITIGGGAPSSITVPLESGYSTVIPLPVHGAHSEAPISSSEGLTIAGDGSTLTTLTTDASLETMSASPPSSYPPFSYFTVTGIHFDRNQFPTSQGTLLATSTTSIVETLLVGGSPSSTVTSTALTVYIPNVTPPGFNTPLYNITGGAGAAGSGGNYMRAYDNSTPTAPTLDMSSSNYQLKFHAACNGSGTLTQDVYSSGGTTATFTCPGTSTGNTFTFLLGDSPGSLSGDDLTAFNFYNSSLLPTSNDILCFKDEGGGNGFLNIVNDSASGTVGGTDITLNDLILTGEARASFSSTNNITVEDVTIEREPAQAGQAPCLSTSSGGLQFHTSSSYTTSGFPTYGNTVLSFSSTASGDDSIAFFGDTGGTGTFATSTVSSTTIHDSFARGVIVNTPADQSDAYLSYVNVFPYAGSSGGTLCGGAPYPYVSPPNPNPACPSGSNTITSINSECPYSISGTVFDATTLELCPVRIQPWSP